MTDEEAGYDYVYFNTTGRGWSNSNELMAEGFEAYSGKQAMTIVLVDFPESDYDVSTSWGDQNAALSFNETGDWGGISVVSGKVGVQTRFGGARADRGQCTYTPTGTGALTSVVAVKDGTTDAIYINGEKKAEGTERPATIVNVGTTLTLGSALSSNNQAWQYKGRIMEVLIYDRALSEQEIAQLQAYINAKYLPVVEPELVLTTAAHNVKADEYFTLNAEFVNEKTSNAAMLSYAFDGGKFEAVDFIPADGVAVVNEEYGDGVATVTLMIQGYNAKNLGDLKLHAKVGAELVKEKQSVQVAAEYAVLGENGEKTIENAEAAVSFTTVGAGDQPYVDGDTNGDGVLDMIDLSNIIDWFGYNKERPDWELTYTYFDFNNNGLIDISDVTHIARLIK
jgi:hypothetical protein